MGRDQPVGGKQGQWGRALLILIEHLDGLNPGCLLAVIDLPQIKHRALDDLAPGATPVLHNAPIVVILPVFEP